MERDPFRLSWAHSKIPHLIILVMGLCSIPLILIALDLPRQAVDDVIGAGSAARLRFLDVTWTPPLWLYDGKLVFLPGWTLSPGEYVIIALAVTLSLALFRSIALGVVDLWRAYSADKLVAKLDRDLVLAVSKARHLPSSAIDGARRASASITNIKDFLAAAVTTPFFAGGRILLICSYLLWLDPRAGFGAAILAILLIVLAKWHLSTQQDVALIAGKATEGRGAAIVELGRRWRAFRAHGAHAHEVNRVTSDLSAANQPARQPIRRGLLAERVLDMMTVSAPLVGPVLAVLLAAGGGLRAGSAVSMALALAALAAPARSIAAWNLKYKIAQRDLRMIADTMASLRSAVEDSHSTIAATGSRIAFEVDNLVLAVAGSMPQLRTLNAKLNEPAHIALMAPGRREAELAAAGLASMVPQRSGYVMVAGQELDKLTLEQRSALVGFVSADPVLIPGTWFSNLSYGSPSSLSDEVLTQRVIAGLSVAGLDETLRRAALAAPVDPVRNADLASVVVDLRGKIRAALVQQDGWKDVVDPFRTDVFNRHATIGENIMFGQAVGDTFAPRNLAGQPFLKAVLEAENLTQIIADIGLNIARTTTELLAGIADENPLVARLGFFEPGERGLYADIVARQGTRRNGAARTSDRDKLLALALRYIESRHRLGLVDEALEQRLLDARRTFARLLPPSFRSSIDAYDPDRVCRAASLADNLLFGRIAYDVAGADERVAKAIRDVIMAEGRDAQLLSFGLSTPLDMATATDNPEVPAAIDLTRVLIRAPQTVVLAAEMTSRLPALRTALAGKTMIAVCLDDRQHKNFDGVFNIETGLVLHGEGDKS
jgi:ABC-type multidrug transport system fused ATPase/permease subunit